MKNKIIELRDEDLVCINGGGLESVQLSVSAKFTQDEEKTDN
jgi:hypothetical protein